MITSVVLVHNEEKNLTKCLQGLLWCDQIIIIDDFSTDHSTKIALKLGAKVYKRHLNNNFAAQRNFGLSRAREGWVLFVDSDEVVSLRLAKEIRKVVKRNDVDGYLVKRTDIWQGRTFKYGEFGQTYLLRLARKNSGRWVRGVHEYWQINGKIAKLHDSLLHYPHPTVAKFISQINRYSVLHASENIAEGKKIRFINILLYPVAKFFVSYIVKSGFRDGQQGFIAAMLMSLHSFLAWSQAYYQKNYS